MCVSTAMNRGEPSDDLSKIRGGEILSSGDPFTSSHGLIHVPNAHTGKLTPGSGTWGVAPRNPFFLVHSGGCGHTRADYR